LSLVRAVFDLTRGRYAPSPTGTLHLGNVRTALLAWLFARCEGGRFLLPVEDLDRLRVRVRPGTSKGLDWDEGPDLGGPAAPYIQSERTVYYDHFLQRLRVSAERVVTFDDLLAGQSTQHVQRVVGDFILHRADPVPAFVYVPLYLDSSAQRLTRRDRGTGLQPLGMSSDNWLAPVAWSSGIVTVAVV
jgi:glutamyl/glutaminyl-tRNA synthetase